MQGQILDAAVTSNQGFILGDDGARYTFTDNGWRNPSVKAVTGMRVEFNAQASAAMDVMVVAYPAPPAPAPAAPTPPFPAPPTTAPPASPVYPQPAPPQVSQAPYPPSTSQPPPQPRVFTVPATPVQARPSAGFIPRYPQAAESKATIALLLIFLGPVGMFISYFIIGATPAQWITLAAITFFAIVAGITFPPILLIFLFAFYVGALVGGIILLATSEEKWNQKMHFQHDHQASTFGPLKGPEHCRTGVCRPYG